MRIAILSDIHGNLGAFEAVLADIRDRSPDLVLHGGDLADAGSSAVEIVDWIRDLGWDGVSGNTDEMLVDPQSLDRFAETSPSLRPVWSVLREMAEATREVLGNERLGWLRNLPRMRSAGRLELIHASPKTKWQAPAADASEKDLEETYGDFSRPLVVYGHIHVPFIRTLPGSSFTGRLIANSGSVGLPYDGDPRAAYLLVDEGKPAVRRVEYNVEGEMKRLAESGLPHRDWTASMLRSAEPQLPPLPRISA